MFCNVLKRVLGPFWHPIDVATVDDGGKHSEALSQQAAVWRECHYDMKMAHMRF
jgi:hypothetical protein